MISVWDVWVHSHKGSLSSAHSPHACGMFSFSPHSRHAVSRANFKHHCLQGSGGGLSLLAELLDGLHPVVKLPLLGFHGEPVGVAKHQNRWSRATSARGTGRMVLAESVGHGLGVEVRG